MVLDMFLIRQPEKILLFFAKFLSKLLDGNFDLLIQIISCNFY
jgi:hypothetical protein